MIFAVFVASRAPINSLIRCDEMAEWRREKQAEIDRLLKRRDEVKAELKRIEIQLERAQYWGD